MRYLHQHQHSRCDECVRSGQCDLLACVFGVFVSVTWIRILASAKIFFSFLKKKSSNYSSAKLQIDLCRSITHTRTHAYISIHTNQIISLWNFFNSQNILNIFYTCYFLTLHWPSHFFFYCMFKRSLNSMFKNEHVFHMCNKIRAI